MWEARKTVAVPQARGPADLAEPAGHVVLGALVGRLGEDRVGLVELDQQAGAVAGARGRLGREQGRLWRPPAGPAATRRLPGSRPHRPAQPAPTPHPGSARRPHPVPGMPKKRPRSLQAAATGPCRDWMRQSAGVSVDSNGACRGGSGGAAGRGASRWPSRPAGRSPAGRPAAARRGSPRGIPRAATTRIESTRWRRDRQEASASTVEPGQRKSAPHARDAPRRWPCLGTLRHLHAEV